MGRAGFPALDDAAQAERRLEPALAGAAGRLLARIVARVEHPVRRLRAAPGMPPVGGGVKISFGSSGQFVFQAANCRHEEIDDMASVARAMLALYRDGQWEDDWVVVDAVLHAGSATIMVSDSKGSELSLTARGTLSQGPLALANAQAGLSVSSQSGQITQFIAAQGLTPLYRISRIKRSLLDRLFGGEGKVEAARAAASRTTSTRSR